MQSRKLVRTIALILVFVLVLTFVIGAVSYVASAAPSETDIENLEAANEGVAQKITEVESKINSFEYDNLSMLEKKEMLDRLVILSEEVLTNLENQILKYDVLAEELSREQAAAHNDEKNYLASITNRIRAFEENGILAYLSLVFEAENFAEFLGRIDLMKTVIKYDANVFSNYSNAKNKTNLIAARIDGIDAEKDGIRKIVAEKEKDRNMRLENAVEFLSDIESSRDLYDSFCIEIEERQKTFENILENKTAEQVRINSQILPGSGSFMWPVQSSNVVSVTFGTKLNATHNIYRVHNGVDISGEYGSEVSAADDGLVTAAGYDPVYGNYVLINHGNGFETLYAQLSVIKAEEGTRVSKGTVIAKIGTTGYAVTPHLHFEIRLNDVSENPLTYYTGYKVQ